MASMDFEKERAEFRDYYNDSSVLLHDAATFFCSLVTAVLRDTSFEIDAVTARLKDREECIAKFSRKYREKLEETTTEYEIKDWISDLIGVRVVCLYDTDIYHVQQILKQNFEIVDESDKKKTIEASESAFGYKGVHLDLKLGRGREKLSEYQRYKSLQYEVQIRTISQDAWSTLDHKIKYKKNIPVELKRRINRLAGLFELADQEFVLIRDAAKAELQKGEQLAEAPAHAKGVLLDVFGFLGVMRKYFPTFPFIDDRADAFLQEVLVLAPNLTTWELADSLETHLITVGAYRLVISFRMNPFTEVRHALFVKDPEAFGTLLFPSQRGMFEEWLKHRNAARQKASDSVQEQRVSAKDAQQIIAADAPKRAAE